MPTEDHGVPSPVHTGGDDDPKYNGRRHEPLTLANYYRQPFHGMTGLPDFDAAIHYGKWLKETYPHGGAVAIVAEGIAMGDGNEIRHYMVDFVENLKKFRTQVCLNPNPRPHGGGLPTWYTLTMDGPYVGWYLDVDDPNKDKAVQNDPAQIICACAKVFTIASNILAKLILGTPKSRIVAATDSSRHGGKISFHLHFEFDGAYARALGDMIRYVYALFNLVGRAAAADAPDADDGFAGAVFSAFAGAGVTPEMARLVLRVVDPVPYKYKANIRGIYDAKAINMITAALVDADSPLFASLKDDPHVDLTRMLKREDPLTPEGVVAALRVSLLTYDEREGNRVPFEFPVITNAAAVSNHATFTSAFTARPDKYMQPTVPFVYLGFPATSHESTCLKRFDAARAAGEKWALATPYFAWHPAILGGYKTGITTTAPAPVARLLKVKFRAGGVVGKGTPPQEVVDELILTVYEFVLGLGEHMEKLAEFVVGRLTWGGFADKHTGLPVLCAEMDTTLCPRRLLHQECLAKGVSLTHTSRKATIYVRVESGRVRVNLHDLSGSGHIDAEGNALRPVEFVIEHAPHTLKYLTPAPEDDGASNVLDQMEEAETAAGRGNDFGDDIVDEMEDDVEPELPDGLVVSSDEEEEEEEEEVVGRRRRRRRVITSDSEEEEEEEEEPAPRSRPRAKEEVIVEEVPSDAEGTTPSPAMRKQRKKSIDRRRAVNKRHAPYADGIDEVYDSDEEASGDEVLSEHGSDSDDSCIVPDDDDAFPVSEFQPDMTGDCFAFDVIDRSSGRELGTETTSYVWFVLAGEALLRARGDNGLSMLRDEAKSALFSLASNLIVTETFPTPHPTTGCRTIDDVVDNLNGACESASEKLRLETVYVRTSDEIRCVAQPKWLHSATQHFINAAARHFVALAFVDWEDLDEEEEKPTCGTAEALRALLDEIATKDDATALSDVCTSIMALIPPPASFVGPDADVVGRKEYRKFLAKRRAERRAEAKRADLQASGQMLLSPAFFAGGGATGPLSHVKKAASAASAWDVAAAKSAEAEAAAAVTVVEHVGETQPKKRAKATIDPEEERKKKGLQSIAGFFSKQ